MKKYLILTSILALAACGGGSGGGSGSAGGGVDAAALPVRAAVTDDAVLTSNGAVTSMATEILVANDNSGAPILHRAATVNQNGHTYTSYRLDDVNFRVATGANDAFLKFNMDDSGKIDSLVMNVGDIAGDQHMERYGDTNKFRGIVYEYIVTDAAANATPDEIALAKDKETRVRLVFSPSDDVTDYSVLQNAAAGKCPSGKVCRWDRIDQAFQISSQGSDFKYSDFGKLQTTNFGKYKGVTAENLADSKEHTKTTSGGVLVTGTYQGWNDIGFDDDEYDTFAGGYNVAAVQHRPTETTTFTGKAIGSVYATNDNEHPDTNIALQDNAATLTFAVDGNGATTETLNMAFANWYNVKVTKTADGNNITFSHWTGADDTDATGTAFRDALSKDNFTTTNETANLTTSGILDMGYYGVGTTEEATGVVRYKEKTTEAGVTYEREFRAGYGMKPESH